MSYIKRKFLVSRRYGVSLWGQAKDPVVERKYPPGQHGIMGYVKKSEFAKQLEAKQKLKFHYNMREKQFRKLYRDVVSKKGDRVENLVSSLEKRLDALLYRSKLAPTIFSARQMVGHAHVLLNGKKVNIPSLIVPIGSVVQVRNRMVDNELVVNSLASEERKIPEYLECDPEKKSFKLLHTPALVDIPYPFVVDVDFINHIIAFYSH